MSENKQLTFIDFFAGIGGFRCGLEQAGHRCLGYIENDKYAMKSYRVMYETGDEFYHDDIATLRADELPRSDIWAAGFPCQDISIAGRRSGLEGNRSGLFFEFIRLVNEFKEKDRPDYLILENVKNLLSINGGFDFLRVQIELGESGYDAEWQVLNACHYGVPQNRERLFIIGHNRNRSTRKIFPLTGSTTGTLKQIIGGAQGQRVYDTNGIAVTLGSQGGGMGANTGLYFIDLSKENPKITANARCIQAKYNKGCTNWKGEISGVLVNKRIRKLTTKECFRLQGFPDELFYKAQEVNSDSQLYKQAGNSVVVPIIKVIGDKMISN